MHKCHKNTCPNPRTCKCRTVREAVIPVVWLIGGTGSGKMTLGKACAEHFGMDYLSTGELLREAAKDNKNKDNKTIDKNLQEGQLVDDQIVVELIDRRLRKLLKKSRGYIISFAKNLNQAELFEQFISPVDLVIYLEASDDTMMERSKARATEAGTADDDTDMLIRERLTAFRGYIGDVQKAYKEKMRIISAEGTPEVVLKKATEMIEAVRAKKEAEKPVPTCGPEEEIAGEVAPVADAPVDEASKPNTPK